MLRRITVQYHQSSSSKMEVGDWGINQNPISLGPDFALSAESRITKIVSKILNKVL